MLDLVVEAIRTRDSYQCQLCGGPGTDIHHIISRSLCKGEYSYLLLSKKNLILLCRSCHIPSPSRAEKQTMLRFLRQQYFYEYHEKPFLEALGENG